MVGVAEYGEGMDVKLGYDKGRPVIVASNEGGYASTFVDLIQVLEWVRNNMPDVMPIPKPLTDEAIIVLYHDTKNRTFDLKLDPFSFASAVERAHGIGEKDE